MPDLIDMGSASPDNGLLTRFIIVAAAFVVVAVLFAVCSVSWSREADPIRLLRRRGWVSGCCR